MDRNPEELKRLGLRIKRARQAARLSQVELGALVGASARTIGNWERGKHDPENSLGALEEILGPLTAEAPARDPIEASVQSSELTRSEKHELLGHYYRILELRERHGTETG